MKTEASNVVCTATLEFDYIRLSMRDVNTGEGCAMFLRQEAMPMLMREMRRLSRQMRAGKFGVAHTPRAVRARASSARRTSPSEPAAP